MASRYDYMSESKVIDEDGETWPDPLSVKYNNSSIGIPKAHQITAGDIEKFWNFYYKQYGNCNYDDVLLSLNGIPYIGMLEPGDQLALLEPSDISNFMKNQIDPYL